MGGVKLWFCFWGDKRENFDIKIRAGWEAISRSAFLFVWGVRLYYKKDEQRKNILPVVWGRGRRKGECIKQQGTLYE